jgi:hypothetical protein
VKLMEIRLQIQLEFQLVYRILLVPAGVVISRDAINRVSTFNKSVLHNCHCIL